MKVRDRGKRYLSGSVMVLLICLVSAPLAFGQAVDDETCMMCHDGYAVSLERGPHRLSSQITNPTADIACVSCHSGGETHIEDPNVDNIGSPSRQLPKEVIATCTGCHNPHTEQGTVGFDPHIGQDLSCVSCHSVHAGYDDLLIDESAEFCGECHAGVTNQFRKRSNHPVVGGNVTCLSCHQFTIEQEANIGHGGNATCFDCHSEQVGPFLFEHEATSSFSPEGSGCVGCHQPHGSVNERLLNQPGDLLCQQCHGVPPGHRVAHNGIGSEYQCIECHSAVHGSYNNRFLLDDMLGVKIGGEPDGCYCHEIR